MSNILTKTIQVFLATYNRPVLVQNAIESVLGQTFDSYELIVSDNSTNDETERIIKEKYNGKLRYIHRIPTSNNHFNLILDEVESDYFMIFHDDDVMLPDMIAEQFKAINNDQNVVAVGVNAFLRINGENTRKCVFKSDKDLTLDSRNEVARRYLTRYGIVPFPSYLYRKSVAQKFRIDTAKGGKHCDAAWIMDLTFAGNIVLLKEPLMIYSIHRGQDSQNHSFSDRIKLIKFITRTTDFDRHHKLIVQYRVFNLYSDLKSKLLRKEEYAFSDRSVKIIGLIFKNLPLEYGIKTIVIIFQNLIKRLGH